MKLIVGLGNPGLQYEKTRHNVGYLMIDQIRVDRDFSEWKISKHMKGYISEGVESGEKILLLKPTTYMNLSGESVNAVLQYYKIDPTQDLLVICDDLDMDFARVRYRERGSSGGQNGLKSIIAHLGTENFSRLKIGIGRDPRYAVSDWVLSQWKGEEQEKLDQETSGEIRSRISEWIKKDL